MGPVRRQRGGTPEQQARYVGHPYRWGGQRRLADEGMGQDSELSTQGEFRHHSWKYALKRQSITGSIVDSFNSRCMRIRLAFCSVLFARSFSLPSDNVGGMGDKKPLCMGVGRYRRCRPNPKCLLKV